MAGSSFKSKEFLALKRRWYGKLKEKGFEDIECIDSQKEFLKRWDSLYFHVHFTPQTFREQEEYFILTSYILSSYSFESATDEKIWELHTNGKTQREIAEKLRVTLWRVHNLIKKVLGCYK